MDANATSGVDRTINWSNGAGNPGGRRSLTAELVLWIVLLIMVPLALIGGYFYLSITSGLKGIESEKARKTSVVTQKAIEHMGDTVLSATVSNGFWNDNREALLRGDRQWLLNNVANMARVLAEVDFVAETDLDGRVVMETGDVKEFRDRLAYPSILAKLKDVKSFTGLFDTSKGVAAIAAVRVSGDLGEKPSAGALIVGKLLKPADMAALKDKLQTDIALALGSGQYLTSNADIRESDVRGFLGAGGPAPDADGKRFEMDRSGRYYKTEAAAPLYDMDGREIGAIYTQGETISTSETAARLAKMAFYAFAIMGVMFALIIYLLRRRIILPLRHMGLALEQVAAGKTVEELPEVVRHAEDEIAEAIRFLSRQQTELERQVKRRTEAVRNLLNHSGEGFLTFGRDLAVRQDYSAECVRLFGLEIAGLPLPELLYPDDESERLLFADIALEWFGQADDELRRELVFSLLPEELAIGDRVARAEYRAITIGAEAGDEEGIMVILNDITEKRRMENRIERERNALRMVLQVATNWHEYADITNDYRRFCEMGIVDNLGGQLPLEQRLMSVYKRVHTLKGSFAYLQFDRTVAKLHELETAIHDRIGRIGRYTAEELLEWFRSLGLPGWMEEDLAILREALGDERLSGREQLGTITLKRDELAAVERLIATAREEADRETLLEALRRWRCTPFLALVEGYADYMANASEKLGLKVAPLAIEDGDVWVDSQRFRAFAQSLIHVFRNIVVHGIELPEERVRQGKDACGRAWLRIAQDGGLLDVTIGDDGRGIDADRLRMRAVERGMLTQAEADASDEAEALRLIFRDDFSTAASISEWSGRGVGLSSVLDEAAQLGGTAEVGTRIGEGTQFRFRIPIERPIEEREGRDG